ncbi:MAG: glycosyl hydrolase [Actinomycetota bacterium]
MTRTALRRRRWSRWGAGALGTTISIAMLAALLTAPAAFSAPTTSAPATGVMWGAYANAKSGQSIFDAVTSLEGKVGRKLAIANKYHPFTDHSYTFEQWQLDRGQLPLISWRGTDDTPDGNRAVKIAAGQYDDVIRAAADGMKALSGPVLLRFNWEMDQSPGDREYIGTPTEFIQAWRHIYDIFAARGANNVEWVWAPRAASFKKDVGPQFYPGNAYVDWIGGSAVPINNFASFEELYRSFYDWGVTKSKPLLIWAGIQERGGDPNWKANWFDQARTTIVNTMPELKAFVYYHALAPKGGSFWADTTNQSLASFSQMGNNANFGAMLGSGGSGGGGGGSSSTSTPPPTSSSTPPPVVGTVLFADDFEDGDVADWTMGNAGLTLQGDVSHGAWAVRETSNAAGDNTFATRTIPGGTSLDLVIEFDYKVVSAASSVSLAKLVVLPTGTPLCLNMKRDGTLLLWNGATRTTASGGVALAKGDWHHIKIQVSVNGAASDVKVWADANLVNALSGTTSLGTSPIGALQLGNSTAGRTYDVVFDDVVVSAP